MRFDNKDTGLFSEEAPEENKPKKKKSKKKVKISESQFKRLFKEEYYESRKPVDGYVDGDDLVGQHLWVHTNRTHSKNGWNGMIGIYAPNRRGRRTGSPLNYTNEIRLSSPIYFETSDTGAKRIQKSAEEGKIKRTLIAGVSGIVIPTKGDLSNFEEIDFDPVNVGYFFKVGDPKLKKVIGATEIYFRATEDGHWLMLAKDIEYEEDSLNEDYQPAQKPTFEDIYDSLYDTMFNQVCRKYTKDDDKAQEYCQEGFVKVWRKFDKYDGKGSIEGWVRYVIKNTILDIIRKESKMKYADSGEDSFDFERLDHPQEETPLEMSKSMADVRNVMSQLPPQYQRVFSLYYVDGLTHPEIAEELGISVGTSKSNLFKAKKKIQKLLGGKLFEQDEEGGGDTGGSSAPSGGGGGSVWTSGASSPYKGPGYKWESGATTYKSITRGPANPLW
jgi:RNA polymerase sigma-70 factor (ECF subfamily)